MTLETERLLLRPWRESDAEDLYTYASDPDVGPIAGWPPHNTIEESLSLIRDWLSAPDAWAICRKTDGRAIGSIRLRRGDQTDLAEGGDQCELSYWLGKPFWGQGIMPEAAQAVLRHAFRGLGMSKVWAGYYDGNVKSRRVQEKLGFRYQWTTHGLEIPLLHETRTGHVNLLTREDWLAAHPD